MHERLKVCTYAFIISSKKSEWVNVRSTFPWQNHNKTIESGKFTILLLKYKLFFFLVKKDIKFKKSHLFKKND